MKEYKLTSTQEMVLTRLRDEETDIIVSEGQAFIDCDRTNMKLVNNLLRLCCLRAIESSHGVEIYMINETGIKALETGYVNLPF